MSFWLGMAALGYGEAIGGALLLGCAIWIIAKVHARREAQRDAQFKSVPTEPFDELVNE